MIKIIKYSGFTLIEIVTVAVLVAVLASVALPQFKIIMERFHASQGEEILLHIYASQKRWSLDHSGSYTATMTDLDVELPSDTPYFVGIGAQPNATPDVVGRLKRDISSGLNYGLYIETTGEVFCYPLGIGTSMCAKLGYPVGSDPN